MKRMTWRSWMHLHLYVGLFCLPYLLIFGLSSWNFNHHWWAESGQSDPIMREAQVSLVAQATPLETGQALLDSLGIYGWCPGWKTREDSLFFFTGAVQPGREIEIRYEWSTGHTEIKTFHKPVGALLRTLHFLGEEIPHAPWWVNLWPYYQGLTAYAMLFWISTGLYLWLRKKQRPPVENWLLLGAGIVSIGIIVWLWLAG